MLNNSSNHIEQESKNCYGILNKMQNLFFFKFCNSVLSFPAYKLLLEKFGMHSLSLLHKTLSGNIDTAAVTISLKQQGRISEEYFGGDAFRTNEDGDL